MKKDLKEIIGKDIYRYYGRSKMTLKEKILVNNLNFIIYFRKAQYYKNKSTFLFYVYKLKLNSLTNKYHFQIPVNTSIGEGFMIEHFGRIIINSKAKIGKNCTIATGVTIGQENRGKRKGYPNIGDEVWIGCNCVIVGNVKIGNNVLIAPNTFVNFDVPDNSIVIGNPAKIIHNDKATETYIFNKIQ